jgi:hypothetical protein
LAQEDGHEQVDDRDAVRIVEKRTVEAGEGSENAYLVDAETGRPIRPSDESDQAGRYRAVDS